MDRLEAIFDRGRRAKTVLENETVVEALDAISDGLLKQWRATTSTMTNTRETLFHQVAAVDALRAQLRSWVEMAAYEQAQLDKKNDRRMRLVR